MFDDIPNTRRVVEDILIFSPTYEEHIETVRQVLDHAKEHSISLNPRKVVFAESSAPFGGFIVDAEGFRPDPALLTAISQFPTPLNITDLRAFFGLCQQLGNFSPAISSALVPLFPLLKKGLIFEWTSTHDDAFKLARTALSAHHSLAFYDPALPTSPRRRFPSQRPWIPPEAERNRFTMESCSSWIPLFIIRRISVCDDRA